eukprot:jgi/Botrbrau1/15160/Bobra.0149s0027.2
MVTRWNILWFVALSALFRNAAAMYCGDNNCYELLGAKRSASEQDIKKLYRRLSLKYHPDKNPDAEAKHMFQQLARANEILTNDRLRRAYDYYLDHPDDRLTNEWRYYEAQFTSRMAQSDVRLVVAGAIAVVSVIQYFSKRALYIQAMENIRKTPRYKNLLKRLQSEAEAGSQPGKATGPRSRKSSKKDPGKLSAEELKELEERADAEVIMHGGYGKPVWHELFAVQLVLFPVKFGQYLLWQGQWFANYTIRGLPYSREDQGT